MGVLKALFGSKKFVTAIAGLLAALGVQFIGLDEEKADGLSKTIAGLAAAFVVAQGAADIGKEKAKAENGS